jgi:ADP-ribose pyrophosphatase YjhB (NUDIX family)
MKKVVASAVMFNSELKMLMCRNKLTGSLYCSSGGKVEGTEMVVEAIVRELREETGITTTIDDLEYLGHCEVKDKLIFFHLVYRWTGEIKNMEPEKHSDWEWLSLTPVDSVEGAIWFEMNLRSYAERRYLESRTNLRPSS